MDIASKTDYDCWIVVKIFPRFSNGVVLRGITEILAVFKDEQQCRTYSEKMHKEHPDWGIDVYSWDFDDNKI